MDTERVTSVSPAKTVLSCERGRMVIIEQDERERVDNARMVELAQGGKEEGYVLFSETSDGTPLEPGTPGLFLSILLRPVTPVQRAGLLSAATAVAVARAIEKLADVQVGIRWVNDLFCGKDKMAAMMTSARIKPNGYFDYAVIGITVTLSPDHFQPKIGDVIRRVFNGELRPLSVRLTEAIVREFFLLYDRLSSDNEFLPEYRSRSTVLGKRAKVLVGDTFLRARVLDIDEDGGLTVQLRGGAKMKVSSRSEIVF